SFYTLSCPLRRWCLFPHAALCETSTLSLHDALPILGRIEIRDTFSIVEVAAASAERVIQALNGVTLKGRSLRVDYDRKPVQPPRSEEHTSELQSRENLVCRLLLEKKKHKECANTVQAHQEQTFFQLLQFVLQ